MPKIRMILAALAGLAWQACALAATDCAKTRFAADESASAYFQEYGETCVQAEAAAQWKDWKLPALDGKPMADFSDLVPAWRAVADAFDRLAAGAGGEMRGVYTHFAGRARATGESLRASMESREKPEDVALFRSDAWTQVRLNLQEYKQDGEPFFQDVDVAAALDKDCADVTSAPCTATLAHGKQFMLQWRLAENLALAVSTATIEALRGQVEAKDALWNRYLYDSKPMLPLDFFLTEILERDRSRSDQYPQGFREPPEKQWFLLHPTLAIDYASAARDGEQLKPVLQLEVIGVNYWNNTRRPFDVAVLRNLSGLSLTATYADRDGLRDSGFGMLVTFDNVYSLGVTRYGSETGFSLSLDLANMFRDKLKPRYEAWKGKLKGKRD